MTRNTIAVCESRAARMLCGLAAIFFWLAGPAAAEPIKLHPENPHYLLFRGEPTVLITSAEHYGAVLNLDFDYVKYLDELQSHGLNQTRTFAGTYCEDSQSFQIHNNTLAPAAGRFICPWARSDTPGYAGGGNKFDLTRFDEAYFSRLKDFLRQAESRHVVVELVLFCPFYEESMWSLCPVNSHNNVNGIGELPSNMVYTLQDASVTKVQEELVVKLVTELNEFDNLYYEICNEPYFRNVLTSWQTHVAQQIKNTESKLPKQHLIAQNIANGQEQVEQPVPGVSILNFHYATPPDTVALNERHPLAMADDETGFRGSDDLTYRSEGWEFMLAGGAIYSNLDYSFTPDAEDGSAVPNAPGGGGDSLRGQLSILKKFLAQFDFVNMRPDPSIVISPVPDQGAIRALVLPGKSYAVYIRGKMDNLELTMPEGKYQAHWIDTLTGQSKLMQSIEHQGGTISLKAPEYSDDVALKVLRDE